MNVRLQNTRGRVIIKDTAFCRAKKHGFVINFAGGASVPPAQGLRYMQKNMYFDYFGGDCFAAVTEGDRLVEFHLDPAYALDISGNIYKGRVVNVLEGMQAAFVSFGQAKNGYLAAGDIPCAEGEPARLNVSVGDEVMVQVAKSPIGTKGARLTMNLSFVGKNLIYLPGTPFLGVSRKIADEETRAALMTAAEKLRFAGDGLIMRTKSPHADMKALKAEAKYLRGLYLAALDAYAGANVGDIVHRDADVHVRLLRDFELAELNKIYIGSETVYRRVEAIMKNAGRKNLAVLYDGAREMLDYFGLEKQIGEILSPRVNLGNGAYLVFDKTEALTVIDVNTGKFIGNTDSLEDTVFETNLLAAKEVARQARLRNLGGIAVVDFIDMEKEEHRAAVVEALKEALKEDRAKCNVSETSGLGLVQFTRKKSKDDNTVMLTKPCPYCKGTGTVLSDTYIAFKIKIAIKNCFADGYENAVVELNAGIYSQIVAKRMFTHTLRHSWKGKRVYMIPHRTYHEEYFTVRGDNNDVLTLPDSAQLLY